MKNIKYFFIAGLASLPKMASADLPTESGLETAAAPTNLIKQTDTRILIAGIINTLLGFLTSLFLILIIYGGFRWMTAAGSTEQVAEAKNIIKNSVIGIAVVLLSYVIVRTSLMVLEGGTDTVDGAVGGEE